MKSYLDLVSISAKKHKKQQRLTIFCIILAVSLVTVIFGMSENLIKAEQMQILKAGSWQAAFQEVEKSDLNIIENRPKVDKTVWNCAPKNNDLYSINGHQAGLYSRTGDLKDNVIPDEVSEGKIPEKGEVLLDESIKKSGVKIGDTVHIDGIDADFKVSGFKKTYDTAMQNESIMTLLNYEDFCRYVDEADRKYVLFVKFSALADAVSEIDNIKNSFNFPDEKVLKNQTLLAVTGKDSSGFVGELYLCASILFFIVLLAGVLMISSTINAGVAQKTKFYGMLRCIGAGKKQIKKIVRKEALGYCRVGIPAGLLIGIVITSICSFAFKKVSPTDFSEMPVISIVGVLSGIAVGLLSVLMASRKPAKKASAVSPLAAVSGSADAGKKSKNAANTKLFKIETGLGIHHALSNKKNFILTTSSFALSIILFLSFLPLINFMTHAVGVLDPNTPDISIISEDRNLNIPSEIFNEIKSKDYTDKVYGRMYGYNLPLENEFKGSSEITLASFDDIQMGYSDKEVMEGSIKDLKTKNTAAVVYENGRNVKINDKVTVMADNKPVELTIKVILKTSPALGDNLLITSEETFKGICGNPGYASINIKVKDDVKDSDISELQSFAGENFKFSDKRQNNSEAAGQYFIMMGCVYAFLAIIVIITILNVINNITMSVSSRMKEYGAMRAIGISIKQMIQMITAEAVTYSLVGSIIGSVIGIICNHKLFSMMVSKQWDDKWNFPFAGIMAIIAVIIITSLLAVKGPAKKIKEMSIIDTLSAE